VLLLAGEPSGDRWAARIAGALREHAPGVELMAMGGQALRRAGVDLVVDSTPLAVVGLTEVLSHLGPLWRAQRDLRRLVVAWRPDVVVPVDYPDFNLRQAAWARARGVRVEYFISPQVWAWRPGRVPAIGRAVSRMLVVFPFEVETYRRAGIPVEHVGHPLLDVEPPPSGEAARARLGLPSEARVLALLPGSRRKEVRHVWPTFLAAARRLRRERADLRVVVPLAPGLRERDLAAAAPWEGATVDVITGAAGDVLAACDVAAVASGTATLETALVPRPLVVGYRVGATTMALSRRLADRDFLARGLFALPNLVLGRRVVPELYQESFTPESVAAELSGLLDDPAARRAQLAELSLLPSLLGGPGCFARTARAILG
jgi:lipid-A-disaccharide synthase